MDAARVHAKAWLLAGAASCALAAAGVASPQAATPGDTPITNVATGSYTVSGTQVSVSGSVTVVTTSRTPATIQFLQIVPDGTSMPVGTSSIYNVNGTQCNGGSGYTPLPTPTIPGKGLLGVPGSYRLAPANLYASGDIVFVRVVDYDRNANAQLAETIDVSVSAGGKDTELLRLTETGLSTGEFIGYIQSSSAVAQSGNCVLNVGGNQKLVATYVDDSEGSIAISAAALIDPLGLLFDSSTGEPVNGVLVTIINVATGLPATVFGNDSTSSFPSTVATGSTVTDGAGVVYALEPGRYQFPRVAPGIYRFAISPPNGYAFPSVVPNDLIQAIPGKGPFVLVSGSRGENFEVLPGPALQIDMPLDISAATSLTVSKGADKSMVAIGEFVPYSVTVRNGGASPVADVRVVDRLPIGFRYQQGSTRRGTATFADPQVSADGRTLEFSLGTLQGKQSVTLRYVAGVFAGALPGPAENTAQTISPTRSNVARASVQVREDLNRTRAILAGRVTVANSCEADEAKEPPLGLAGVRVLMQDGTVILTDSEGRWHADNIRPGTHVLQLDPASLPRGYELRACDPSTRKAGRDFSQFVNVRGGTLWRADFRMQRVASCINEQLALKGNQLSLELGSRAAVQAATVTLMLQGAAKVAADGVMLDGKPFKDAEVSDGLVVVRLPGQDGGWKRRLQVTLEGDAPAGVMSGLRVKPLGEDFRNLPPLRLTPAQATAEQCIPLTAAPAAKAAVAKEDETTALKPQATVQLVEKLPYDDKWIAAASEGAEWLHPQTGFVPALPYVKVAVKHAARHTVELRVNGAPANPLKFDGVIMNPAATLGLSMWRAVELRDGANLMEVTVRDGVGAVVLQEARTIHFAIRPDVAIFEPKRSSLVADGRNKPQIAVRLLDRDGQPVRRGATGEIVIAPPYQSQAQAEAIQREPLAGGLSVGRSTYQVRDDGLALIELQPTSQAGEVAMTFDFGGGRTQDMRVWLTPDVKREWVLVGFAEGTLGHKRLSGNMESLLAADADDKLFDHNRVAFFAKGQIKGEYLLTLAYDSAKQRGAAGSTVLSQAINPNQYYTLYGDATQPQYEAASLRKLYLKIEKSQFYAMFGDFDTGLSVAELGRYSRTLNGFKTEYKGEVLSFTAFASQTAQSYRKDEIQGDGTSGVYRLTGRDILVNSDKLRIEVRDRLRPEVIIDARPLSRYIDYQIDHVAGTVFFREPIASRDFNFNPVFIVAEYESQGQADAKLTYGGRVAAKVGTGEVGLTHVHEGNVGREGSLTSVDANFRLGEHTKLRAETARSERTTETGPAQGNAYVVEMRHDSGTVAATAYARGQDGGFGLGQQAAAAGGTRRMGADASVKLSPTLTAKADAYRQDNEVNDARADVVQAQVQWAEKGLTANVGARMANETDKTGRDATVRQITGGGSMDLMGGKLTLRASTELDVGSSGGTESASFPNRVVVGADYRLTPITTLFVQHEITSGDALKSNTTRLGMKTEPWRGAEALASVGTQFGGTDSGRMFANLGLTQRWEINEQWRADLGVDRGQTLRSPASHPFNDAQALPSGTLSAPGLAAPGIVTGNYTAIGGGLAYKDKVWSGSARLEWRDSDTETKINLLMGAQRNLDNGNAVAAGLALAVVNSDTPTRKMDVQVSYAHRPHNGKLMWLDRLEYVHESRQDLAGRLLTRKLINNMNANWMPNRRTQVALQYGSKYVLDTIDNRSFRGYTDLIGIEARYDILPQWDVGLHAGMLRTWKTGAKDYHAGISVGFKATDNAWVSVGYNLLGFADPDFAGAEYRAKGLYLNLRVKFDQDTFDLNDRKKGQLPVKP